MDYQFDVDHAKRYGLEEAVMLHNFIFWIRHNHANRKNQHDGRTWTYNTLEAFGELFPFWSVKQIRRILDSLLEQRVLVKGNHNARAYDRTCWYALANEALLELPGTSAQTGKWKNPNGRKHLPKRADLYQIQNKIRNQRERSGPRGRRLVPSQFKLPRILQPLSLFCSHA